MLCVTSIYIFLDLTIQALYLEQVLLDKSFYDFEHTMKPKISEFAIIEPDEIGVQKDDS